ncbi:hypothetical protein, partial [Klebsiella variicola]|uniref:hypothetical protein n=1 Tax=Klebsiella variicola TaxID=244366 RepID=UPI002730C600
DVATAGQRQRSIGADTAGAADSDDQALTSMPTKDSFFAAKTNRASFAADADRDIAAAQRADAGEAEQIGAASGGIGR